jgi:hypothetical protein
MARTAALIRRLVNGERDVDALEKGLPPRARQLLLSILEELGRLDVH